MMTQAQARLQSYSEEFDVIGLYEQGTFVHPKLDLHNQRRK